ncbi:MAG: phosphohistidine phosphatase SixA [Deltaproteobacteria bacterium]|nr:phosphohistidine phosphatase SixA [Deltaproteobacteria bacterium]
MKVYLVQHGVSSPEGEDPQKGLTNQAEADVEKMARFIGQMDQQYEAVFHSDKKRARQTAQILGKHLKHVLGVHETDFLGPMDDVDVWRNRILCSDGDPVLVGHLPFLNKLASRLVAEDENKQIVSFQNGGMVCLEGNSDNENFSVKWAITPDMIS